MISSSKKPWRIIKGNKIESDELQEREELLIAFFSCCSIDDQYKEEEKEMMLTELVLWTTFSNVCM